VDLLEWIAALEVSEASTAGNPDGYRRAVLILGAAEARREEMGAPIPPASRIHHAETTKVARNHLGAPHFDTFLVDGRAMTLSQAVALAAEDAPMLAPAPPPPISDPRPQTPAPGLLDLTERELEVLRLLADGLTNKEIAERLVVSYRTVQTHLYRIFSKLDVTTRSAATGYAIRVGLV
jgi:DNA-binding NarL/FixJ family response regulator